MAKNKTDFLIETAKDNKSIQMDELISKPKKKKILSFFFFFSLNFIIIKLKTKQQQQKEIKAIWDKFDLDHVIIFKFRNFLF